MANNFKIGATLAVDGEKEFKKALADANKELKLTASEAKAVSSAYDTNSNSLKKLVSQREIANKKVEIQRAKVEALKDALDKLNSAEEKDEKKIRDYSIQLNNATADLNKFTDESKAATKELIEMNPAAQAAKKGVEVLGKVGLAALKGAAIGAATAVTAVTAGAVALGKAVWEASSEASEYGDKVDKASQKMGVTAEQFQQLSYAADLAGTSTETLQKATQKLQKSGSELNIDQALQELYKIPDADERAAAAHEMFGDKIANELAPMLNQGGEAFEEAKQKALDYGLAMSDSAVKASAAFNDTKTTMTDTLSMIKNNLAADFLPGINDIMSGITGIFTGEEGATEQIINGVNKTMESLGTVVDKVTNILGNVIDAVVKAAPEIIASLSKGLTDNFGKLTDAAFEIVTVLMDGLLTDENLNNIMNAAVGLITKLVDFLTKNAGKMLSAAIKLVTSLINSFSDPTSMNTIIHGMIDMVGDIVDALVENAPMLIKAAWEMAKALVNALIDYDWVSLAKKIYNSIKDAIVGFFKGGNDGKSHAGGLGYVPYDGYVATLHKGERVLTAAENTTTQSPDLASLTAKVDSLLARQQDTEVQVNFYGTSGAVARALNYEIKKENKRASAFA